MAKKSKFNLSDIISYAICGLALVALIMAFLPFVTTLGGNDPTTYSGFQTAFGCELASAGSSTLGANGKLLFSFPLVLAIFLPLIASVLNVFVFKNSKLGAIVNIAAFVVATVFIFMALVFGTVETSVSVLGSTTSSAETFAEMNSKVDDPIYGLGIGAIIAAIINILGGVLSAYKLVK